MRKTFPTISGVAASVLVLAAAAARAAGAPPTSYRAVPDNEVPRVLLGMARDWGKGREEYKAFQSYVRDRENWTPGFLAVAGAFGYFQGGRGSARLGGWNLRMDTAGQGVRSLLKGRDGRLLGVGLGRTDLGWSAGVVLGVREGRFLSDSVSLGYKLRY
jgi:hypothetical protein